MCDSVGYYVFTFSTSKPIASSRVSDVLVVVFICRLYFCMSETTIVHLFIPSHRSASFSVTKNCGFDQYLSEVFKYNQCFGWKPLECLPLKAQWIVYNLCLGRDIVFLTLIGQLYWNVLHAKKILQSSFSRDVVNEVDIFTLCKV